MNLRVVQPIRPIGVFDAFDPEAEDLPRQVFINDKRCPLGLEQIILRGLDAMAADEMEAILKELSDE